MSRRIYDRFVNRLGEAMKAVQFGNPAERTDIAMGPLINAAALERVEQKVARAVQEGPKWSLAVKRQKVKGIFIPNAAAGRASGYGHHARRDFGPVLPVVAFDTRKRP